METEKPAMCNNDVPDFMEGGGILKIRGQLGIISFLPLSTWL